LDFVTLPLTPGTCGHLSGNEQDPAADHTGLALLVDETGVAERAAVTNVEPNMDGFGPFDDLRWPSPGKCL
jgi:hypothetical protein